MRNNGFLILKSSENEEFQAWAEEEVELQRANAVEELSILTKSGELDDKEIPDYMLKLLNRFDDTPIADPDAVPQGKLPIIAIIGRPNTGKSTIVNRLTNSYKDGAIVHDEPGITRDRTYRIGSWCNYNFQVVDTGGIIFDDSEDIFAERITEQALIALKEANAGVMICDGKEGLTQMDITIAQWLRRNNKVPIYLAVNKCESETRGISQAQEFWKLGLGAPYPVSGIHGTGLGELLDEVTTKHMTKVTNVLKENSTNIAFIGRPNVGKSSLFNRLYGEDRSIVSNVAGTTRDTIDALIKRNGKNYRIVDTAGIRKKGKVNYGAEFFMVNRAFKAIRRSEVVVLLLDAVEGILEQDRILAEKIANEGRSCVIALNKWDAIPKKDDKTYLKAIENIPTTGQRTDKLFESIERAASQFSRRISTAVINEVVNDATMWMAPPSIGSRSGRIYYCIQVSTAPPTLVFFVNDPDLFTDNYQRYLERKIRDALDFEGTPIKMIFRGKALRDVGRAAKKGDSSTARILGNGATTGGQRGYNSAPVGSVGNNKIRSGKE
eukprot:gene7335-9999_t